MTESHHDAASRGGASGTVRLAWHHVQLTVPAAWEVIGFTTNSVVGELALTDRHGQRLQVAWRQLKREPALRRRLVQFATQLADGRLAEGEAHKCVREMHGWTAFLPESSVEVPIFAARFLEQSSVLVQLVFPPHRGGADLKLIGRVLASFRPNDGEEVAWSAFGLEFALPRALTLEQVTAVGASQVMRFENRRGESVTVHRYGMLRAVLGGDDLAAFFARIKGGRYMIRRAGEYLKDGKYPGVRLAYETHGKGGFDALLAPVWCGRVWLWRCDDLQRLYAVDQNALEKNLIPDLPEKVLCR